MADPHPAYWKVKAAVVEAQLVQARAQASVDAARARQMQVLAAAGLDPTVNYELIDAEESITPKP